MMSKDLLISEIKVTSPTFVSLIRPKFTKTEKGFVLAGYNGDYQPTSGSGVVKLDVKIEHQSFNGMQLPSYLTLDSLYDGAPTHMELAFSEYQVKNH
jgi:hypothetical protein